MKAASPSTGECSNRLGLRQLAVHLAGGDAGIVGGFGRLYAVGVSLYYLLTGKTPFEGDNLMRLLTTVLERPAESPQKWRREIPAELGAVILRCSEV